MKKNSASPLFIVFLILSAQIVKSQVIQVVNVNLVHPQQSSNQYLDDYHQSKLKNSHFLPHISSLSEKNVKAEESLSNQSQNNQQVDMLSGISGVHNVIVNVNVNEKGSISTKTSKTHSKEQQSKRINLRNTPTQVQIKKEKGSQTLLLQKENKLVKSVEKKQETKNQQQGQKEVVSVHKQNKQAEVMKQQKAQDVKIVKFKQQIKDTQKPDQEKEHKYISKFYIEAPQVTQAKQKQMEVGKQSGNKQEKIGNQKLQEQKKIAVQISDNATSEYAPKETYKTNSPTLISQTKVNQTQSSQAKKIQISTSIVNNSKYPTVINTQSNSISKQNNQAQSTKQSVVQPKPIQPETKSGEHFPLVQKSNETIITPNVSTSPKIETIKAQSEKSHNTSPDQKNEKSQSIAERKSIVVNPVPVENLKPIQPQTATTPIGGVVDMPAPPIIKHQATHNQTITKPTQEKMIATNQSKQELTPPLVNATENPIKIDPTLSQNVTQFINKQTESTQVEPAVGYKKTQQSYFGEANQTANKSQQNNIIKTPISILEEVKAEEVQEKQDSLTNETQLSNPETLTNNSSLAKHYQQTKSEQASSVAVADQNNQQDASHQNDVVQPEWQQVVNDTNTIVNDQEKNVQQQSHLQKEKSKNQATKELVNQSKKSPQNSSNHQPVVVTSVPAQLTQQTNSVVSQYDLNSTQNEQVIHNPPLPAENNQTISHILNEPVSNTTQIKANSVNQPVEYLSVGECNPGCDISSQAPVCYHQSCRGCFTDDQCSSIMGNNVEGVCHLQTGKCIANPYSISQ